MLVRWAEDRDLDVPDTMAAGRSQVPALLIALTVCCPAPLLPL